MRFQSSFKFIAALVLPALLSHCIPHIDLNSRDIPEEISSMPSEMELTLFDDDAVYGTVTLVDGKQYDKYMFYTVQNGWTSERRHTPVAYAQTRLDKGKMPEVKEALAKEGAPKLIKYGDDDGRPVRQYWIIAQGTIEEGQAIMGS